jgi:hypothetical protein
LPAGNARAPRSAAIVANAKAVTLEHALLYGPA